MSRSTHQPLEQAFHSKLSTDGKRHQKEGKKPSKQEIFMQEKNVIDDVRRKMSQGLLLQSKTRI